MEHKLKILFITALTIFIACFIFTFIDVFIGIKIAYYVGVGLCIIAIIIMASIMYYIYLHNKKHTDNKIQIMDPALSSSLLVTVIAMLLFADSLRDIVHGYDDTFNLVLDIIILSIVVICVIVSWTAYGIRVVHKEKFKND